MSTQTEDLSTHANKWRHIWRVERVEAFVAHFTSAIAAKESIVEINGDYSYVHHTLVMKGIGRGTRKWRKEMEGQKGGEDQIGTGNDKTSFLPHPRPSICHNPSKRVDAARKQGHSPSGMT